MSSYPVGDDGERIWIITEVDRSSTCILLPDEYRAMEPGRGLLQAPGS